MKPKKKKDMAVLAVKAARRESREEEIRLHGKPIRHHHVVASKKVYNRKKDKADRQRGLPRLFMDTEHTELYNVYSNSVAPKTSSRRTRMTRLPCH